MIIHQVLKKIHFLIGFYHLGITGHLILNYQSTERIIPIGYSYLNKKILKYSHIKEDRLVIISQPRYANELVELAIDIAKAFK